jgi:hypothetical protein
MPKKATLETKSVRLHESHLMRLRQEVKRTREREPDLFRIVFELGLDALKGYSGKELHELHMVMFDKGMIV